MQSRRAGGLNLSLVAVVGALLFYLFFVPADFRFNFSPSKTASLSPPPPYVPQEIEKQCPVCPEPITCPPPAIVPDPGENAFCLGGMQRCNAVGLPDDVLCRILDEVIKSNHTSDVCATGGTSIPHIIHQSYKSEALPENFATW
jgi:hypothetical protein